MVATPEASAMTKEMPKYFMIVSPSFDLKILSSCLVNIVAFSPGGFNILGLLRIIFEFFAQVSDMHHDRVVGRVEIGLVPDAFVNILGREYLFPVVHHEFQYPVLNVGQGDGAVIRAPYRFNVLIDGGGGNSYSDYNPGEKVYLDYLETEGITKADSAFVSHYHQDHVQGIIAAMENIKVRNLFLPDNMEGSEWRVALENSARENGTTVHYISQETLLTYNNGMTIRIIPPSNKTGLSDDENDTSYVYYVEYNGFSATFTGDMSSFAEKNLIDDGKAGKTNLLKVAHHGSNTATCEEWVEKLTPEYAVISVDENNPYNLPNDDVLERLENAQVFRTDYDGDIKFIIHKNGSAETDIYNRR